MATREESAFSGDPGERGRSEPPSSGGEAVRKPSTRIPILDGWRATSILCVLGAHLVPLGPKALQLNFVAGAMGMALFFCLSGFLIVQFLAGGMPGRRVPGPPAREDHSARLGCPRNPVPLAPIRFADGRPELPLRGELASCSDASRGRTSVVARCRDAVLCLRSTASASSSGEGVSTWFPPWPSP